MLSLLVALTQAVPSARLAHAEIWFDARATVADFQGRTTVATGELLGGPGPADARGWIEVRWRDIDTRNGTRNRHMLKTVDEAHFPVIRFDIVGARPEADSAVGTLALHGVTRQVTWPVTVRIGADTITVASDFPVDMRDYGIKPPVRFVIARMGAVVNVHVRLVFVLAHSPKNQTRGRMLPGLVVGRSGRHTPAATLAPQSIGKSGVPTSHPGQSFVTLLDASPP
ncbi:MAG: YceI family protein [Gemmatimonadales bacterium]